MLQGNVETNLMGTMYACRSIGKSMMMNARKEEGGGGGGVIVNVASLLGVKGGRGSVAYAASKAGVIGEFL
jgi:NAD(P)-dependent dehydrogenase (short-subunit alcohol dehydrogenase family)